MRMWHSFRTIFCRALELLLIVMVAVLTLTVLWGVFTRFVLGSQAAYTDELARVLLVWISMGGSALAFGTKSHLGVDYFANKLEASARKCLFVLVQVIILMLAVVVFIVGGWDMAVGQMGQVLPTIPFMSRGMVYLAVPLGGVFIMLFSIENMIKLIRTPAEQVGEQTQSEG